MKSALSGKHLILAALGVGSACAVGFYITQNVDQEQRIQSLEVENSRLRSALESREVESHDAGARAPDREARAATMRADKSHADTASEKAGGMRSAAADGTGSLQILKDLDSASETDLRSYLEKLQELLSGNPTEEEIAIASRFIFEKAGDRQGLPDYALQSLYASQSDPDLRRVIAQVLSQRGNNTLLNNQIAEAQAKLMSRQPRVRQDALAQLAKMHSTQAVDAIAPFLQDPDTTVRLEALFALRDTGNQHHVHLVEGMVNDPDPSVSALAADVLSSLRNLSASARTSYSRSEIEAELPPIANP